MITLTGGTGPLPAREAYRLWAPGYHVETAVSALERRAALDATPDVTGRSLLDAGCGTGRRLNDAANARLCVGIDLVSEMIRAGAAARPPHALHAVADVRALPLSSAVFDVVWCRLVLGHLPDPVPAYAELARVAAPGARLVMSDFHAAAAAAGHTRSFRDEQGVLHGVVHHTHDEAHHVDAAGRAGWRVHARHDLCVGSDIRSYYADAGALDRYEAQLGLPLVLLLVFER